MARNTVMQLAAEAGSAPLAAGVTVEELVDSHLPRIHRFAVMVSPLGTDPDDLAQDACLRAIERAGQFDPQRGSLDAWLWRIVVNLGWRVRPRNSLRLCKGSACR